MGLVHFLKEGKGNSGRSRLDGCRRAGDPRDGQGTCLGRGLWLSGGMFVSMELWETQKLRPLLNVARVRPDLVMLVGLVMGEPIVLSLQVEDSKCAEGMVAGPV